MIRKILFAGIVASAASICILGCSAPCNYPSERGVVLRIINAMPDIPRITVFINGKVVVENYFYNPPSTSLYLSSYKNGSPLPSGDSILFVVSSDAAGKDVLISQKVSLNFHRQTIIAMGRGHIKPPQVTARILWLDDESDQWTDQTHAFVRFVNAVPDLDSIDVYFKKQAIGKPNLTLKYGHASAHIPLDTGAVPDTG